MADPTKKTGSKSTAKGTGTNPVKSPAKPPAKAAEKTPEKPATATEKKRATTTKSLKAPVEPAKAKTAPQVAPAPVEAAKPPEPAKKPAKIITARATKAAEETSPLMQRPKISAQERHALIAQTAYFLFTQRGGHHGRHLDDWVAAEALITARLQ